jgi:hypothetical protein
MKEFYCVTTHGPGYFIQAWDADDAARRYVEGQCLGALKQQGKPAAGVAGANALVKELDLGQLTVVPVVPVTEPVQSEPAQKHTAKK